MEEAGVSDNYSDGNKAGFLTTDCHFLYVWFPSLPTSLPVLPVIQGAIPGLKDCVFCSLSTQNCSPRLPTAPTLSPDAQYMEKNAEDAFPCATGDGHNSVLLQQMSHISYSLKKPRNESVRVCLGGEGEQRNDGRCLLTDSMVQIRPSVPRRADASCTHTANAYIFHISHATPLPLPKKAHKTPNPPHFRVHKNKSHLRRIYSFFHRGFNYLFAFRIKDS